MLRVLTAAMVLVFACSFAPGRCGQTASQNGTVPEKNVAVPTARTTTKTANHQADAKAARANAPSQASEKTAPGGVTDAVFRRASDKALAYDVRVARDVETRHAPPGSGGGIYKASMNATDDSCPVDPADKGGAQERQAADGNPSCKQKAQKAQWM